MLFTANGESQGACSLPLTPAALSFRKRLGLDFIEKIKSKLIELLDVFNPEILLYYLAIAGAMLLVEMVIVGWPKSSIRRILAFRGSVKTDFAFFMLDVFNLYNLITVLLTFGAFHVMARLVYEATHFDLLFTIPGIPLQFLILFLVGDLKNYVSHWVFHRVDALWKLHEFHHSATEFCMLTRYRGHFLETAMKRVFDVIPFAIFGSIESYFAVKVLVEMHQLALHSAFTSNWGWIGRYVIVSPAAHRIHHSAATQHYNRNMGSTFIFWDRLFGTYHDPDQVLNLGVEENPHNNRGVLNDVISAYKSFFAALKTNNV